MSEVYYEVHMTCVLHTARTSHIDSVMFVNRIRETCKVPKNQPPYTASLYFPTPSDVITAILISYRANGKRSVKLNSVLDW